MPRGRISRSPPYNCPFLTIFRQVYTKYRISATDVMVQEKKYSR